MELESKSLTKLVVEGVNFIVNTPIVAALLSIPIFFLGLKIFKKGLAIKNSFDYQNFRALGTGIGLFILSIMLIINTILTLTSE